MNKKNTILKLLTTAVLFLPAIAFAQDISLTGMIDSAVMLTLYIGSAIVVILWVITGIMFLTAQGDPAKLTSAKKALFASIIGTVLVFVASSALTIIGNMLSFA